MIKQIYKGFFIVSEFNNKYDIRTGSGTIEAENLNNIEECKNLINTWI
jgi:hypothetical protein